MTSLFAHDRVIWLLNLRTALDWARTVPTALPDGVSVDGQQGKVVHGRICSSALARWKIYREYIAIAKGESIAHPLLFSPSATCLADPRRPNITRDGSGPGITGSMAIGVNKENAILCTARSRFKFMGTNQLSALFWQYSNGTLLPAVDRGQLSGHGVYMERYAGSVNDNRATWLRVLHFKTTPPSVAGNYTCVANYNQRYWNHSVEILVSGEWKVTAWVVTQRVVLHS